MSEKPLKPQKTGSSEAQSSLFFSALGMGLGTLASRILGFVRDMVLYALFPKLVTDAFVLGFKVPNFFRRVMGEGALSVSFIPSYLDLKLKSPEEARVLKNVVFTFLFILSSSLAFVGILFMPGLLGFLLSFSGKVDLFSEPETMKFVVDMGRWMFFYVFLVTQFAYLMAVLNANKRFLIAGLAPAFFNLGFILFAIVPNDYVSFSGFQLALGVLFGGLLQILVVGLDHVINVDWPKFNLSFNFPPFKKVLLATIPGVIGIGILPLISLINISLCAQVGLGALSLLYLADRLLELPQSLIAVSLGTAMLPNLSELWVTDRDKFDQTLSQSIRLYLFFALPSAVGLIFMALPIVQLLFQRGNVGFEEATQAASLVQVYGGVLIISGVNKILLPVFYSLKNTWYPACVASVVVVSHYFVGQILVDDFGLVGVVMTTFISTTLNFTCLFIGLKVFIGRSYFSEVIKAFVNFVLPTLFLIGALYFMSDHIPKVKNFEFYAYTLISIIGSVVVYFGACAILKVKEVVYLKALFKKVGLLK